MGIRFLCWNSSFQQKVNHNRLRVALCLAAFSYPPSFTCLFFKLTVCDLPLITHPESVVQLWANISKQLWLRCSFSAQYAFTFLMACHISSGPNPAHVFQLKWRLWISESVSQRQWLEKQTTKGGLYFAAISTLGWHLTESLEINYPFNAAGACWGMT